jgi:hypothetical protein
MLVQVGPAIVYAKLGTPLAFKPLFEAAEVTVTITGGQLDRINDGFLVESVYSDAKVTFEISALAWSVRALASWSVFDSYAAPSSGASCAAQYHRFSLTSLGSVPTLWLRFESIKSGISSIVELPKAKLTEDIPIGYPIGQANITLKGEAMKDSGQPLIIFYAASRVAYPSEDM